jgi:hypothetical protein
MAPKKSIWIIFFFIFFPAVVLRLSGYSNLTDSIGALDTVTYIRASEIDFASWHFFTSMRSATLPLFYKILRPPEGYPPYLISEPARTGSENRPQPHPGWDRVVSAQILVSVLGWGSLAFVMFRRLANPVAKVLAASAILLFGFTPQLADWDNILMSESLSFSLYAILIATVIELAFSLAEKVESTGWKMYMIIATLFLVAVFWTFTRDTNAYLLLYSIIALMILLILAHRRKIISTEPVLILLLLLVTLFVFQQVTFRASQRWLKPLLNNMTANIFPYPARVKFFESKGMPVSPELLNLRGSAEYNGIYEMDEFIEWARNDGLSAYTEFLARTPLWAAMSVYEDLDAVFAENVQPYFKEKTNVQIPPSERSKYVGRPDWLVHLGNILHPLSSITITFDLSFTLILIVLAYRLHSRQAVVWASVAAWLVFGAIMLLIAGYLGEVRSILRHAMAGVVPLRLALWLLSVMLLDVTWTVPRLES